MQIVLIRHGQSVANLLRTHPQEAERYSAFKEELAQRFEETIDYSPAKKAFVREMEQKVLRWFEEIKAK